MNTEGSLAYIQSSMAARVSYALNLTGPTMAVDTACSSSLTAVHLAYRAIEAGDCIAAVVGACQSNRQYAARAPRTLCLYN
jgi:acyl transferase domain-containing protein